MTVARPLNRLPAETLLAICEYLGDSHPRSLLSLALANKHCYSVASTFLYRTITFKAHCPEQLAQDAQRCECLLRRDTAFRYVRRFVVHGYLKSPTTLSVISMVKTTTTIKIRASGSGCHVRSSLGRYMTMNMNKPWLARAQRLTIARLPKRSTNPTRVGGRCAAWLKTCRL